LYACIEKEITISHGDLVKIPCGIAIELPEFFTAFIFARSGLGIKYGISPSNAVGVIDSDYRGEIQVGLCRSSNGAPYVIKPGDRIAQMVILKTENFVLQEVKVLSNTSRGGGGLGSTGR
jgi:dUTP pyrophosphatase